MTRASRCSPAPQVSQTSSSSRSGGQINPECRARVRTAKACRSCNAKRVKCDASERGTPCTRCEQKGEPDCTLINSRRGIYVRKPRRQHAQATIESSCPPTERVSGNARDLSVLHDTDPQISTPTVGIQHTRSSTTPADVQPQHDTPSEATSISLDSRQQNTSWSTMFEGFLHGHVTGETVDKGSLAYVGEAFPLGIILDGARSGTGRPLLHHSAPTPISGTVRAASQTTHPADIPPDDISYLEAKEAFSAPPDAILNMLIAVFMEQVFPLYPIVNPHEFLAQHEVRKLPWILVHSVCFMAATFCPLRILHQAGFDNRRQARSRFYGKAKALFDIGYERSKVVTLQVAILLSFWGGSPNHHCNFYTWISTGVTIAETIGCHRSMTGLNIASQDRSLLKRVWWTLVVRDAACASMHGRPFKINLDHCDVDELVMEDFEFEDFVVSDHARNTSRLTGMYQIQMAKLALLLRTIVTIRFYPRSQDLGSPSVLQELLLQWRNQLPASLQWTDNDVVHTNVFRTTLCVLYNHNVVLSHIKPGSATLTGNPLSPSSWLGDEVASLSAHQIAALTCSMVTASDEVVPPHELFHGLFMACVVFFVQSRSGNPMTASLGRSTLTNCRLALYVHRDTWDASSWITQLFDKVLARPTLQIGAPLYNSTLDPQTTSNNLDILDTSELFLDGMEGWPNHLFLGDLFDASVNNTTFAPSAEDASHNSIAQFP
ncbi:hypothetical protein OPT61_g2489 [Boeremia exigua]|uniref:Uncharacterized protein n=1 Tax=Boeremia exigua TaxID=749465 RepID=A0ACC2ILB6_9PLEO|nr:hypothetical protein OPT61_g2489 [Boeremia exigua]